MSIDIGIIETPTVRQMFMERIAGMIVSGELKPGDKLPSEREMAAQAKISKSAVHFAMVELERMGFVKTILRQGTYVQDFTLHGTAETLNLLTSTKNFHYTPENVRDIIDMRYAIESAALERLADNLTDEAIAAFRADIEMSKRIMEAGLPGNDGAVDNTGADFAGKDKYPNLDVPKLARSFFHFHHNLCVYSGNFVLPLIFNTFKESTAYFWEQPI
ncbi:MAG: GntR family transcriptional regulator, partial [Acutalibacteraceae bacterium]|nr:GntR family transcriptional regulator [Acutalibacteraceae bacterium]MEE3312260.1 GntR family transcriptional regulator [Acutalibacteraceae bacterium]